jgi:hypothetical protein
MDESVERFKAEQKRIKDSGGPGAAIRQALLSNALTVVVFAIAAYGIMSFIDMFPRNPDNSVRLAVFGPVTEALAIIAALILKITKPHAQAIRWTCWGIVALAGIGIPANLLDLLTRSGS